MAENDKKEPTVGLTAADLRQILADQAKQNAEMIREVITEIKKPTVLEQKKLDEEAKELLDRNQERKDNSAGVLAQIEHKRSMQRICTHKHRDGNSHCVHIQEQSGPGYILCQLRQCKIRPSAPKAQQQDKDAIYDTDLFNRLFQELPSNELFN